MVEMEADASGNPTDAEPLRWLMHRGPGTGKSHVIKVIKDRFFKGLLGYDIGVEFQIVVLQAVMAEILGGDTIHHACGIPAFRRRGGTNDDWTRRKGSPVHLSLVQNRYWK